MLGSKNIFAKESAAASDPSSAAMTMKMKGLLKGLRYISQIFDEEEEPELQIGNPTDVKHVAHIGWDGPTANAPSWINKFKGEGDAAGAGAAGAGAAADDVENGPKANEKRGGSDSTTDASSKRKSDKPKASRRKGSTESSSVEPQHDSPSREPASGTKEKSSRRKKSKASSGTSSKTSKSKPTSQSADGLPYSDPGKAPSGSKGSKNKEA